MTFYGTPSKAKSFQKNYFSKLGELLRLRCKKAFVMCGVPTGPNDFESLLLWFSNVLKMQKVKEMNDNNK